MGKRALGRGLRAILPEESEGIEALEMVDVKKIRPNPFQPRVKIDEGKIKLLANSIKEKGIIQPIVLRKKGDEYEIVVGERRYRAALLAGLKEIPARIVDVGDREMLELALVENLEREDLNPIEEARAYKTLQEKYGLSLKQIATLVGKSLSAIANNIRLLNLEPEVQEMVIDGLISEGHARVLLRLQGEPQKVLAQAIVDKDLSVRDIEKILESKARTRKKRSSNPLEEILSYELKRRVYVELKREGKGWLKIEFRSKKDLRELLRNLLKDEGKVDEFLKLLEA